MKNIIAKEWQLFESKEEGLRSCLLPMEGVNAWTLDIRCPSPVTLNAVMEDGRTLYLDWGCVISFSAKMDGFAAFEVLSEKPFMFRSTARTRWYEIPDETKLVVDIDESATKPIADMIKEEVLKMYGREQAASIMSDLSLEELLDDIENGDLDFEEEPDPFGLGHEERMEAFLQRQEEREEAQQEEEATPPATPPAKPSSGARRAPPAPSENEDPDA